MSQPRVLLANHDSLFLDSLSRALARRPNLPFDVEVASESPETFSEPVDYDALVCAVENSAQIPSLRRLRDQNGALPLIALVPPNEKSLAEEARQAGADVVPKNANPESTASLLQTALTLLINTKRSLRLAAETRYKLQELRGAIGEKRRILELSRSISERTPVHQYPVLVVEDDEDAAGLLKKALENAGFNSLDLSTSFEDAVARLSGQGSYGDREKNPLPFLLFLNLDLSGKSGYELLEWLRSRPELRNIIVVAQSPSESPEDIRRAYGLGANSYVTTPSTFEELQQLVNAVRQYWVRLNV
ncbi:MAG TPA: response regulator [Planctomycetota bacterium]|nr:response regulator [Planctomycetota bacterium]